MTAPLFLIAHSVRGEASFDVALQMECPHCHGNSACKVCGGSGFTGEHNYGGVCSECGGQSAYGCPDCDSLGYWWIIPTSGHRAFPFQQWSLEELFWSPTADDPKIPITDASESIMNKDWSGWPDHYHHGPAPTIDIKALFRAQREAKPHIS